ncbi:MAG: 7-carboxy-7-deazaguanine synthase [Acidobacteriia bacterium]|nr:7-carboxy-7-deazaguanine synthase [Terriglobia bacterium]
MSYFVKEIYYTLQGEGANAGRAAVFCQFAGCNLWSGREEDRASAICKFCDTDFMGTDGPDGGVFADGESLAAAIAARWPVSAAHDAQKFVICTGGEPLLQMDAALVEALHRRGFAVGVETNGTVIPPPGIDWLCVSPKAGAVMVVRAGQELKLVYPQEGLRPEEFLGMEFPHFFLQPMDGPGLQGNIRAAIEYCLANPEWRLSLQLHKIAGIR